MFYNKLKSEITALKAENARLQAYIEAKQKEEKAEQERIKQMSNFWAYDGSVQLGGEEND